MSNKETHPYKQICTAFDPISRFKRLLGVVAHDSRLQNGHGERSATSTEGHESQFQLSAMGDR